MCEKEPKHKSCTECPQYNGMKCTATDFTLGDRDEVLQQEHRRGFICLDTGEAELKGDAVLQWTVEQERLSQEKGYKSCEEMWAAEGKQVMCGFRIDKDNKHLEPLAQISNGPGPVKLTFQYEENAKSVDDTMYHPNSTTADCIADMLRKEEGGPFTSVFTAGSPSSECPSLRDGPPQKGKIEENKAVHNSQRLSVTLSPDATCINCNKSHRYGLRLVCDKWGLQDILMPHRPCEKWALDYSHRVFEKGAASSLSTQVDNASSPSSTFVAEDPGIQVVENPSPLFRDLNGFWEPVRPRSCTNCKLYNDPICMKMATHIGTRQEIIAKEEENGFHCFAADQMQQDE